MAAANAKGFPCFLHFTFLLLEMAKEPALCSALLCKPRWRGWGWPSDEGADKIAGMLASRAHANGSF